jgi:uncharacterized protein involved in type VI secretion and phage assembly
MSTVRGVVLGVVSALDDQHRGQVQIEFPAEADEQTVPVRDWARVATLMAGPDRGAWFMPEVGDEVLVAFVNDDAEDPYVIGALWSEPPGTAASPPKDTAFSQRRLKSKRGHTVTLDDGDGPKVELRSQAGHTVVLDDKNDKLEVRSKAGHTVTLDANGIELKVGGRRITVSASAIEFL